jgi:hypothetical protein
MKEIENDPWEAIGTLIDEEPVHVLSRLYEMYDIDMKKHGAEHGSSQEFFKRLSQAIELCRTCNMNRR